MMRSLEGYEEVARAQWDRGTVRVVHNHSSHYLVLQVEDRVDGLEPTEGWEVAAFKYGFEGADDSLWLTMYQEALRTMVRVAIRNSN